MCEKGKKCKYSHDLSLDDARQQSINLYEDPRLKIGKAPDTIITCKDFLRAVEQEKYGFNWVCPQGENCPYLHRLPMGYVINRDKKVEESDSDGDEPMTIEEKIEEERAALPADGLTPVTAESFKAWKIRRAEAKQAEIDAMIAKENLKGKKDAGQMAFMSGKALFTYNPDMFVDDDGAADDYSEEEEDDVSKKPVKNEEEKKEVKVDAELFNDDGADDDVDFDDDE